jgi:hypothetical protein
MKRSDPVSNRTSVTMRMNEKPERATENLDYPSKMMANWK